MTNNIPARIIGYWDKGFDSAPDIVKLCVESWKVHNPDYEFLLLDSSTAKAMFPDLFARGDFTRSNIQTQADLLRLHAVTSLGGVWLDSTIFMTAALKDFLPKELPDGFLVVSTRETGNRFIENYFLASEPGAPFLVEWLARFEKFRTSETTEMPRQLKKKMRRKVPFFFDSKLGSTIWTIPIIARRIGHPYLIVHFLASRMILFSPRWRAVFKRMPTIHAVTGIHLAREPRGVEMVNDLLQGDTPALWKLDWKDPANFPEFWNATQQALSNNLRKGL